MIWVLSKQNSRQIEKVIKSRRENTVKNLVKLQRYKKCKRPKKSRQITTLSKSPGKLIIEKSR